MSTTGGALLGAKSRSSTEIKKCPYCSEEIQDEAIKCRYCGEFLDKPAVEETETDPVSNEVDTEPWRHFSEEYGKAGDPHKRRLWNALNREQRDYVSLQFGVAEPPPPKKKKFGILTYGCLTSIALLVVFSIVFTIPWCKDNPRSSSESTLSRSSKTGLLGVVLPKGAKLSERV